MPKLHSVAGSIMKENPTLFAGLITFTCMFALVAGNALVSQPGQHPGPIWKTRDDVTTNSVYAPVEKPGVLVEAPAQAEPKLAHRGFADLSLLKRVAVPMPRPDYSIASVASQAPTAAPTPVVTPQDKILAGTDVAAKKQILAQTQDRLATLGLYKGTVDGIYGPATRQAIETYQVNAGLQPTGLPSAALLFKINQTVGLVLPEAVAKPDDKLAEVPQQKHEPTEPVKEVAAVPQPVANPAKVPEAEPEPVVATPEKTVQAAPSPKPLYEPEMVRLVQRGLTVFGVEGITVDGVMGERTVEAISRFQERYQLPTTGMPDDRTIMKMLEIGALRRSS